MDLGRVAVQSGKTRWNVMENGETEIGIGIEIEMRCE